MWLISSEALWLEKRKNQVDQGKESYRANEQVFQGCIHGILQAVAYSLSQPMAKAMKSAKTNRVVAMTMASSM
jgi:uncharacterized membrane protein